MSLSWHVFPDADAVCKALCNILTETANQAIEIRGAFHVVLAGGSTPRRLYQRMQKASTDWTAWRVYFSDERHLPNKHPDRNDTMALEAWLEHVPLPPEHIHSVPFYDDVAASANEYARTLRHVAILDFCLLGIGEDGHTASLFPGHALGESDGSPAVLVVANAPKPPPRRISLSVKRLNASRRIVFLATGVAKRSALQALREGQDIPAASIRPVNDSVEIYADESAAGASPGAGVK